MESLGPLDCLSAVDQKTFQDFGFGESVQSPFQCVHHAFESHAARNPGSIAVVNFGETITYADLDRQSNCLAIRLRALGIGRQSRVCLLVERSIHMVVGIVAVLKAGAAYVPLDGNVVSDSTIAHVLHDSNAAAVLILRKFLDRVSNENAPIIHLDTAACSSDCACERVGVDSSPDDSAYIIYTSGTTGVPKGVNVKHGNVTNLLCLAPGNLKMAPGTRVSQLMNIGFDMAAWEILGALTNGATLCLRGKTSTEWRAVMKTVDVVIATPSMLGPHEPSDYPNIKAVAVAGEACPQALADKWAKCAEFYNCCGPTEVRIRSGAEATGPRHPKSAYEEPLSMFCLWITIVNTMQLHVAGTSLSIGRPTPNNNVYVLDDDLQPLPIGHTGLMWAGGAGVTEGYLNLPEKTNERYKPDPFTGNRSIMFNTGDLGRWRPDGTLEHLGRIDDQVKIKGFRVELDGVAAAMEKSPGVKVAVALLIDSTLWGFVTPASVDPTTVMTNAAKIQPYYAVPTRILSLEEFPKTSNTKTDKRALRQLALNEMAKELLSKEKLLPIPQQPLLINEKGIWLELPTNPPPVYQRNEGSSSSDIVQLKTERSIQEKSVTNTALSCIEGYENDVIPDKTQGRKVRNLRHQIFTLYRRLFGVVFITNMAIFIATLVKSASVVKIGEITVANLCCAILMRQDYVINAFFTVFCSVPTSWPLAIRRICARVYHIGGLHSGCATSGVVWLVYFTGKATKELVDGGRVSAATLAVTYWILMFLLGIVIFAYPSLRIKRHDTFERVHRFLGWTATALVWCQVTLLVNDYRASGQSLGQALVRSAAFWLTVVMTGSIILPWIRLRKVPVRSVVLSNHAVRLYFDYVTPEPGSFTRISESPLMEWHGFATIKEPGKTGYSLVVSKAGDWTTKQITEPPTHLWVRGVPTYGVLRIAPLFKRIVLVATGSGIGPCAPVVLAKRVPHRLLWTSPDVRKTFGDHLVDSILEASPDAVIYDTRKNGKPDMVKMTLRLVRESNAEAVCVISNQKLTRKVVYGMMSRGIPAFGAIWDS